MRYVGAGRHERLFTTELAAAEELEINLIILSLVFICPT
jgi:hypothetical protein